jgi:hypothetical protein
VSGPAVLAVVEGTDSISAVSRVVMEVVLVVSSSLFFDVGSMTEDNVATEFTSEAWLTV